MCQAVEQSAARLSESALANVIFWPDEVAEKSRRLVIAAVGLVDELHNIVPGERNCKRFMLYTLCVVVILRDHCLFSLAYWEILVTFIPCFLLVLELLLQLSVD